MSAEKKNPASVPQPKDVQINGHYAQLASIVDVSVDERFDEIVAGAMRTLQRAGDALDSKFTQGIVRDPITSLHANHRIDRVLFLNDAAGAHAAASTEAYRLEIGREAIVIHAFDSGGAIAGAQTLASILAQAPDRDTIPVCAVEDRPEWGWRGMHLDVSRHFFEVDRVLQFIDLIAAHKFNVFHWHLTDDQGWRIEIKQYPKLHEVGGFRKGPDGPYGGYYTHNDLKRVVTYASQLGITVIPEINMPGHIQSAVAAYPELSCTGEAVPVWTEWGISEETLCVARDATYDFVEAVLWEVASVFPGPYIHVGGDEVPTSQWEHCPRCRVLAEQLGYHDMSRLQGYFFNKVQRTVEKLGKVPIAWDEVLSHSPSPPAVVTVWHGEEFEQRAVEKGLGLVVCPVDTLYFDWPQSSDPEEPGMRFEGSGIATTEDVFAFEPDNSFNGNRPSLLYGAQGNTWTELIPDWPRLVYMAYPRLAALSETLWAGSTRGTYGSFEDRRASHELGLRRRGLLD